MTDRAELLRAFLKKAGWENAKRTLLAADASFRHYDLLEKDGQTRVLMDAPPPMEDVRPFLRVDKHLVKNGYSAPVVYAEDVENGFLLLEDFGNDTYTRLLKKGYDETALYALAVDFLADMDKLPESRSIPDGLPPYDEKALLNEAMLFPDWYMPAVFGKKTDKAATDEFAALWKALFPVVFKTPRTLVLRDYHVDNLMLLPQRPGIKACGLLDFQDALAGSIVYDVMSLLEDARRDIDDALLETMRARYIDGMGDALGDKETFLTAWRILAAQRHTKVLGIFTRLCVRDNKSAYLQHIPRLWRLLDRALEHPALSDLRRWFDKNVPAEKRIVPPCPSK